MKYKFYRLGENYAQEIRDFFSALLGFRVDVETRVLKDEEFNKLESERTAAYLETTVVKGDPNESNLLLRVNHVKRTIYIRLDGEGVCTRDMVHEFLHMYYPQLEEDFIVGAEIAFETAFLCYDMLYSNQPLRDFFIQLCREKAILEKWGGLPKFEVGEILRYEKKLLSK